jgi:hypothetical protein
MNSTLEALFWRAITTRAFNSIRPRITHIQTSYFEGLTKNSKKLTALTFADNERAKYFTKMAYSEIQAKKEIGRVAYRRVSPLIRELKPDIVFVDTNSIFSGFFAANDFFVLPYLQWFIDLSGSLDSILQRIGKVKATKKKIRRIIKSNLTYKFTQEPAALRDFYHSMYVPRILERHKEDAKLVSFEEYLRLVQMGRLMLLTINDSIISGAVVVPQGEALYIPIDGVNQTIESENEGAKKIAGFALTYFIIKWAKAQGFKLIDHGASKPFLRDGVFVYKRRWGMSVRSMSSADSRICAVKFCNFGEASKDFLQNNPFVFTEDTKLNGLVFSVSPDENLKEYNVSGISGMVKLSNNNSPAKPSVISRAPSTNVFSSLSALRRLKADLDSTGAEIVYFDFNEQEPKIDPTPSESKTET